MIGPVQFGGKGRRVGALLLIFVALLAACGQAPVTASRAPTQTRVAELATLTAVVPPAVSGGTTATAPSATAGTTSGTTSAPPTTTPSPVPPVPTATTPPIPREAVAVVSVVDGDTIKVRFADNRVESVRYIGIDTPETVDPRTTVECFGREASAKNAEYVAGRSVLLEKDVSERDQYGRLLRYVWVVGNDGVTRHVNEELVKFGYAAASSYPPDVRYQALFTAAERNAREQRLGLWGACTSAHQPLPTPTSVPPTVARVPPTPTPIPQAAPPPRSVPGSGGYACPPGYPIKGNQTSSTGEWIYHVPGGQYYDRTKPEECFMTEADAQAAGYRRSKR